MKIIGHRGAMGLAPENTLLSLKKGLEHGVDAIEVDVRVTKDAQVILHHDRQLKTANEELVISNTDFSLLKKHRADLILLTQALEIVTPKVPLIMEVKNEVMVEPVVRVLKDWLKNGDIKKLFLGSKNQKTLLQLHEALPDVQKVVIEPWSGVKAHYRAKQVGTKWLFMYRPFLWSGFIKSVSRSGFKLYAYPLNDPIKAKKWAGYGLAGVVTDYPDLFQSR